MHGFRVVSGITTPSPTRWGFTVCRGNPYRKQKYEMPLSLTCLTNVCYFSETKHIDQESTCNLLSLTIRILNAYQLYFTIKYYKYDIQKWYSPGTCLYCSLKLRSQIEHAGSILLNLRGIFKTFRITICCYCLHLAWRKTLWLSDQQYVDCRYKTI